MINWESMEQLAKTPCHTEALRSAYARSRIRKSKIVDADIAGRINVLADGLHERCPPQRSCDIMRSIADVIRDDSVMQILTHEARMHLDNPLYSTAAQVVEGGVVSGLVLHRHPLLRVTCATTSAAPQMRLHPGGVGSTSAMAVGGYDSLVMFLQASECVLDLFEVDPAAEDRQALLPPVQRTVQAGDHLFLEGGLRGFVLATPRCRGTMILCSRLLPRDPLTRLYDRRSLALLKVSAACVRDSRLQNLATALASLKGEGNRDALESLTHHATYFVRWHAVRELARVDEDRAFACMQRMAREDPHDEIRSLSRQLVRQTGE